MSIKLDYRVDEAWKTKSHKLNCRELTRFDFNTWVMPGDQLFEIDGKDFSYRGWSIPLLEFSRSLLLSVLELEGGASKASSNPIDIGEAIDFARNGEAISVTSQLTDQSAIVNINELGISMRENAKRLLEDFLKEHLDATMCRALFEWYPVRELGLQELFKRGLQ